MDRYLIFFGVISLISTGCAQTVEREPPVTGSDVLNELVRSAPYQYINLDEIEVQEIELTDEDIIYSTARDVSSDEIILGQLTDFVYVNNRFYVYDRDNGAIFQIDIDGHVTGQVTREGGGPGEHGWVDNLRINDQYIYIMDQGNARINRYTHDMTPMDPIEGYQPSSITTVSSTDLNDEKIVIGNRISIGRSPEDENQGLISISSIESLTDTLAIILPRLVPLGYEPNVYNNPRFSINSQNVVAATYLPLPWFFLFDAEYQLIRTLILEYSVFNDMTIPELQISMSPPGSTQHPILWYKMMDTGDIFVSVRSELIHLTSSSDGTYQSVGRYQFISPDEELPVGGIRNVYSLGDDYYAGSWNYLFRFSLSE